MTREIQDPLETAPYDDAFVVKVQFPLFTTDPEVKAYIYNKDHSVEVFVPIDVVTVQARYGEYKFFMWARLSTEGLPEGQADLVLVHVAPWQNW